MTIYSWFSREETVDLSSSLAVPNPDPGLSEEHSELSEERKANILAQFWCPKWSWPYSDFPEDVSPLCIYIYMYTRYTLMACFLVISGDFCCHKLFFLVYIWGHGCGSFWVQQCGAPGDNDSVQLVPRTPMPLRFMVRKEVQLLRFINQLSFDEFSFLMLPLYTVVFSSCKYYNKTP